jgi:hypothetical protein
MGLVSPLAGQSLLLVPDSTADQVSAFSPFDGSLVNLSFITNHGGLSTPINATDSGRGTVFLSDQVADAVFEYAFDGTFLGVVADGPTNGLNNVRGITVHDGALYIANADAPNNDTIVRIDLTTGMQTAWATGVDPFDVYFRSGDVLVSDIGDDNIEAFDFSGAPLPPFHDSDGVTGIDFPEQIQETSAGDVLVGGFSPPDGVYTYDSTGTQVDYFAASGVRGVFELGNGNIMFTNSAGVNILDVATGGVSTVATGSYRFIELVTIPEPASSGMLLLGIPLLVCRPGKRTVKV